MKNVSMSCVLFARISCFERRTDLNSGNVHIFFRCVNYILEYKCVILCVNITCHLVCSCSVTDVDFASINMYISIRLN